MATTAGLSKSMTEHTIDVFDVSVAILEQEPGSIFFGEADAELILTAASDAPNSGADACTKSGGIARSLSIVLRRLSNVCSLMESLLIRLADRVNLLGAFVRLASAKVRLEPALLFDSFDYFFLLELDSFVWLLAGFESAEECDVFVGAAATEHTSILETSFSSVAM